MRKAEWERDRNGKGTGEMVGFDKRSVGEIITDYATEYDEACASLTKPPYRWGEWASVFHPRFNGQIVGYVRLRGGDWLTLESESGEVNGPFRTKRAALRSLGLKRASKVVAGVYAEGDHFIFTRENADDLDLRPEDLP